MARHAPGDRVDRVLDLHALALEEVGELAHGVLGLRDREPVAGHDHHLARVGEHHGEVVRATSRAPSGRRSTATAAAPPDGAAPNAEKRTFASERFIARPIRIVSRVPEAPTSVPPMMSALLSSTKPLDGGGEPGERVQERDHDGHVGAADRQHEQRRRRGARARGAGPSRRRPRSRPRATAKTSARPANERPLTTCWPGNVSGGPVSSSWSFANAIRLPEKLIEPISAENRIARDACRPRSCSGAGARRWNSAAAMSAAAPPPTPLNSATICGIAVIFTLRAETAPITGADRDPDDDQPVLVDRAVTRT